MSNKVELPANGWWPRDYQLDAWKAWEAGKKRLLLVWPRRHGKDDVALHGTACRVFERVGTYWHLLPQATQARKAIWEAINPHTGTRRIDEVFPKALRDTTREQEMLIRFKNGSTWQVLGSDNYDSYVGSPPVGIVFSEWALCDPRAWAYVRPILLENDGWAFFNGTPRGRNHHAQMFEAYREDDAWFVERLTAEQTGLFSPEQMTQELHEMQREYGEDLGEALWRQEYYCSFDAPILGAYYAKLLEKAEAETRITQVPHDPMLPVQTFWDLGKRDATAIWFVQFVGNQIRLIDHYEATGAELDHYAKVIRARDWTYETHWLPHDAEANILGMSRTREDQLRALLPGGVSIVPKQSVEDGINAARSLLPLCWFDRERCEKGLNSLRHYHAEWDEKHKVLKPSPRHDWSSHTADAFRMMAVAYREQFGLQTLESRQRYRKPQKSQSSAWAY